MESRNSRIARGETGRLFRGSLLVRESRLLFFPFDIEDETALTRRPGRRCEFLTQGSFEEESSAEEGVAARLARSRISAAVVRFSPKPAEGTGEVPRVPGDAKLALVPGTDRVLGVIGLGRLLEGVLPTPELIGRRSEGRCVRSGKGRTAGVSLMERSSGGRSRPGSSRSGSANRSGSLPRSREAAVRPEESLRALRSASILYSRSNSDRFLGSFSAIALK